MDSVSSDKARIGNWNWIQWIVWSSDRALWWSNSYYTEEVYLKICKAMSSIVISCLWSQKCTAAFIRQPSVCIRWLRHTKPEWPRPATSVRCYSTRSHTTWSWCWSLWLTESGHTRRTTSIWRHIRTSERLCQCDVTIASFKTATGRQKCSNCTLWPNASRPLTAIDENKPTTRKTYSAGLRLRRPWWSQKNEAPCPNFEIPSNRRRRESRRRRCRGGRETDWGSGGAS